MLNISASNCLSAAWKDGLAPMREDPDRWQQLLELELAASSASGCLDLGTHIIAVVKKPG